MKHLLFLFQKKFHLIFFIFSLTFHVTDYGFAAGTLVKIANGYKAIETVQIKDPILCFDNTHHLVEQPIVCTLHHTIPSYIQLIMGSECICLAPTQKVYLANTKKWIRAQDLRPGNVLVQQYDDFCVIEAVKRIQQPLEVYDLTIANHHNFCVSHLNIKVHNVIPFVVLGFGWAFGLGAIEFSGITLGVFAGVLGIAVALKHRHNKKPSVEVTLVSTAANGFGPDPDDKKNKRDDARATHQPLTNKQARQLAQELGYKEDPNPPFNTRDRPAFRKGNDWITPDSTGHKGGTWKRYDNLKREGTYNALLTIKIGS